MGLFIALILGFGGGLIAARTSTFSGVSESAYQKTKELKDKVLPSDKNKLD